MGDRVSVSFSNKLGEDQSVVLFHHWGGECFVEVVKSFLHELSEFFKSDKNVISDPLSRLEPESVMFNFIGFLCRQEGGNFIRSSLYLGKTKSDGDNSDNGHYTFRLSKNDQGDIRYTIVHFRSDYLCYDAIA